MSNILLTGGRLPSTLSLARTFHQAGHSVFMAESVHSHVSQVSKAIQDSFILPPPRLQAEAYVQSLRKIIQDLKIDLLIPMFGEIFHIAAALEELPCKVLSEPFKKLAMFHNKWHFVVIAVEHDLYVPETMLINNQNDLLHAFAQWRNLILKPLHSHSPSKNLTQPTLKQALAFMDPGTQWIAQEHVAGQLFGTYSLAHNGRITAHTTYPFLYTARDGTPIAIRHVDHPGIFNWVSSFLETNQFTGQIGFEFLETADGHVRALTCHPHSTIGMHLLTSEPDFVQSFFDPHMETVRPADQTSCMLAPEMLLNGLPDSILKMRFGRWLSAFWGSDDIVLDYRDPLPFLLQIRSIFNFTRVAIQNRISLGEAFMFDLEMNWEDPPPAV